MITMDNNAPTDAELAAELANNPDLLDQTQRRASKFHFQAVSASFAPRHAISKAWDEVRARTAAAERAAAHSDPGSPAEAAARIEKLKIAREAVAVMAMFASMTQAQRYAAAAGDENAAVLEQYTRSQAAATATAAAAQTRVSPAEMVAQLARRGISLSAGADRKIVARPAALL